MKLLHVVSTPRGIGGAERVLLEILKEGHRRGLDQIVLNPFASGTVTELGSSVEDLARYIPLPATSLRHVPRVRRELQRLVAKEAPALVHAHLVHAIALTASIQHRGRSVATVHHGDYLKSTGRKMMEAIDRWALKRYDRVVAVSGSVESFLRTDYGIRSGVVTIRNGHRVDPGSEVETAGSHLICVANLRPEKDHATLLRAMATIRRSHPEVDLVLIGSGPAEQTLRSLTAELGVQDAIRFIGSTDPLPHLRASSLFVLASTVEPFGMAALEAMAVGLPVIATSVGGLTELVQPGITGELFPAGDHEQLASHIERLLMDPELRRTMGNAGRSAARELTMDATVQRYFDLYDDLLAQQTGGN